jgi:general secretion pathway protein E
MNQGYFDLLNSTTTRIDHRLRLEEIVDDLLKDGLITREQAEKLRFRVPSRHREGIHPLVVVANQRWQSATYPAFPLDLEQLTRWLAEKIPLPYYRINPLKIDVGRVTSMVSHAYAARFRILPIAADEEKLTVATAEPFVHEWERELAEVLRLKIGRVIANPLDIARYLTEFYGISRSIHGASKGQSVSPLSGLFNVEQLVELGKIGEPEADNHHIVHIVDWLLVYAFEQRASDIHLEPRRQNSNIRFRIDGVLHLVHQFPTPVMAAVVSRIKTLGRMDLAEKRRPQDGRIRTKAPDGQEAELRLSTMPTTFGEKMVMRIFNPQVSASSFKDLGFSAHDTVCWEKMVEQPNGIILVTGPTGSGKTTTLYSTLRQLARPEINVCTIEDPIEMVDPQLNQMHVQHNIGLDFATGVRTLMRQDPDIIMIGEIRDRETAEAAIQAALTGHLVLSTLHTNDAPSAITRLLDIGVPAYLINATLLGVMAQRLVRTLCRHCRELVRIGDAQWQALVAPFPLRSPARGYAPVGCDECRHTGYRGRIGLYEMVTMSPELRKLVLPGADIEKIRGGALKEGMRPLRISGALKVLEGVTTLEEVFNVVPAK